jgi:hypothetical protein
MRDLSKNYPISYFPLLIHNSVTVFYPRQINIQFPSKPKTRPSQKSFVTFNLIISDTLTALLSNKFVVRQKTEKVVRTRRHSPRLDKSRSQN